MYSNQLFYNFLVTKHFVDAGMLKPYLESANEKSLHLYDLLISQKFLLKMTCINFLLNILNFHFKILILFDTR